MRKLTTLPVGSNHAFLTVLRQEGVFVDCLCACGKEARFLARAVHRGHNKSCGCKHHSGDGTRTHGQANKTPEYQAWQTMIQRCTNPNIISFPDYGGRGIKVCPRWRKSFINFFTDMGPKPLPPRQWSLDRIDNDKGYHPGNCRWARAEVQNNNTRITTAVSAFGETHTVTEWATLKAVPPSRIKQRLRAGWAPEAALSEPPSRSAPTGRATTHNRSRTSEYSIWKNITVRCRRGYAGISPSWAAMFSAFYADMGDRPSPKHSIDRIDSTGPYSKENCRWATPKEQARNTHRNHFLEHAGERYCVAEWGERRGLSPNTIHGRLNDGWTVPEALGFEQHVPESHLGQGVKDLTGQRFGMLTVIGLAATPGGNVLWQCRCDCGGESLVLSNNLAKGNSKSCGCRKGQPGPGSRLAKK
jgi:hypothetical protein